MSTSKSPRETPPDNSTVILLLADIADTTWRMFVPILGGVGLGFWGDTQLGTSPWLVLAGILVGVAVTALLIKRQFNNVRNS